MWAGSGRSGLQNTKMKKRKSKGKKRVARKRGLGKEETELFPPPQALTEEVEGDLTWEMEGSYRGDK